jgi:hypothetical protein
MNFTEDDVLRLYDIPPEEFLHPKDLRRFEDLYGKNTRGVQLAKQAPDLYREQFAALKAMHDWR